MLAGRPLGREERRGPEEGTLRAPLRIRRLWAGLWLLLQQFLIRDAKEAFPDWLWLENPTKSCMAQVELADAAGRVVSLRFYVDGRAFLLDLARLDDLYHEDVDLGWRQRLMGCRVVLAPRSVVYDKSAQWEIESKQWTMQNEL